VPFCAPSVHVGGRQTFPVHTRLAQSATTLQVLPAAHAGQARPPQSVPDSSPFFAPSLQVGGWQRPSVHTPVTQSEATAQRSPSWQRAHEPPQSTLVSVPFFIMSLHVAA
jgi:hypothetical protein